MNPFHPIAKPQAKVDGRALWEAAREAALKSESDYGLFGDKLVCSERAAVVVAKATVTVMCRENHGFGIYAMDPSTSPPPISLTKSTWANISWYRPMPSCCSPEVWS